MKDLKEICKKLEKCSKHKLCCGDKIVCTRKFLKQYVGNDYNKVLKLKVELKDSYKREKAILPNWSIVLSTITLFLTVTENLCGITSSEYIFVVVGALWITSCMLIGSYTLPKTTRILKKWRNCIEVVLEDMEKFQ